MENTDTHSRTTWRITFVAYKICKVDDFSNDVFFFLFRLLKEVHFYGCAWLMYVNLFAFGASNKVCVDMFAKIDD